MIKRFTPQIPPEFIICHKCKSFRKRLDEYLYTDEDDGYRTTRFAILHCEKCDEKYEIHIGEIEYDETAKTSVKQINKGEK